MSKLVSVIVPIYNSDKYLDKCIRSIIAQTYTNLEIILINDGSTDKSLQICNSYRYDSRIHIVNNTNQGVSKARNTGLMIANGDYIGFVDADDIIHPQMYEILVNMLEKENAMISAIEVSTVENEKKIVCSEIDQPKWIVYDNKFVIENLLLGKINVAVYSKLFRREILYNIQFPNEKRYNEDKFFVFLSLLKNGKYVQCNEKLYFYCKRDQSATSSICGEKNFDSYDLALEILHIIRKKMPEYEHQAEYNLFVTEILLLRKAIDDKVDLLYSKKIEQFVEFTKSIHYNNISQYMCQKEKAEFIMIKINIKIYKLYRIILNTIKTFI